MVKTVLRAAAGPAPPFLRRPLFLLFHAGQGGRPRGAYLSWRAL